MLFQSVGARYDLHDALAHALTIGKQSDSAHLKNELEKRYRGHVALYRKGRAALAEAVRIATNGSGKVAICGFTCYSVVEAVEAAGCTPVYIDIDRDTLNFTAENLQAAFRTHADIHAVVVQNSLGIACDIEAIERVASANQALLIEDLAHSAGATYASGQEVGTVGDITMLSMGRDKALDCVNGGALIVRRAELIVQMHEPKQFVRAIDQLRDRLYPLIAWKTRVLFPLGVGKYILGFAYKSGLAIRSADGGVHPQEAMPNWLAKRAARELLRLSETNHQRRQVLNLYAAELREYIVPGTLKDGAVPIRVPLYVRSRARVLAALKARGYFVEDVWYDRPVSPARLYKKVDYPEADNSVSTEVARQIMNLPTHAGVRPEHIAEMAQIIREESV